MEVFEEQTAARLNSADNILFPITLCEQIRTDQPVLSYLN